MSEQPLPPEARQFDFWIGEWELSWGEDRHGHNSIKSTLDEAVILENFDGKPGTPLRGLSVSTYNAELGKWQQTWVDNQAGYVDFVGEFKDGQMILQRRARVKGEEFLQRMVWHNIAADQLDWEWERSDDEGLSWRTMWHVHYVRQK
jgi:hypothetical protein